MGLQDVAVAIWLVLLPITEDENAKAGILNNLGNRYLSLGKREDALAAGLRAVKIYERLAENNPQAFELNLAMSCGALGAAHHTSRNYRDAATAFK